MSRGRTDQLLNFIAKMYGVGSTIITPTNTNPATLYDAPGEWELIQKGYKYLNVTGTDAITFDSTNAKAGGVVCYARLFDNNIEVRFCCMNKVACSDATQTWGTLQLSNVGLTAMPGNVYFAGECDNINGVGLMYCGGGGTIYSLDWITIATTRPTTTDSNIYGTFHITSIPASSMIDSFCDRFYWRRTA